MKLSTKNYLRAISMLVGMAIGVGIFGVPYVIAKSGAAIGAVYFVILGAIVIFTHLIYGEAILRTKGQHRLAGLAQIYLGKWWKRLAITVSALGLYAVIIAYIIVGGQFLKILVSPFFGGALIFYQIIFWVAMALIILRGLRTIVFSELLLTVLLVGALLFITVLSLTKFNSLNFSGFDAKEFFVPYGIILFSITASAAVPEVLEVMGRDKKRAKSAIFWGSLISIALMAVFAFAVLGALGGSVSKESVESLGALFGSWVLYIGAFFGLFAVATSFLPLALYSKEQFKFDFKCNGALSWFLACGVPFLVFLLGTKDFIKIISFSGAVFSGFEAFLVIWIYSRAKKIGQRQPEYAIRLPLAILAIIGVIFLLGMAYEIKTFF